MGLISFREVMFITNFSAVAMSSLAYSWEEFLHILKSSPLPKGKGDNPLSDFS